MSKRKCSLDSLGDAKNCTVAIANICQGIQKLAPLYVTLHMGNNRHTCCTNENVVANLLFQIKLSIKFINLLIPFITFRIKR